jgi:hypothetical protein
MDAAGNVTAKVTVLAYWNFLSFFLVNEKKVVGRQDKIGSVGLP